MIDQIHMLSLDKRAHLWPKIEEDCERLLGLKVNKFIVGDGIELPLEVYDYVDSKNPNLWNLLRSPAAHSYLGHANAFLAHKQLFKKIYEQYQPFNDKIRGKESNNNLSGNILFLEDDCLFLNRFKQIYNSDKVQKFLEEKNFDALYLGWWKKFQSGDSVDGNILEHDWKEYGAYGICREYEHYTHSFDGRISGLHGIVFNSSFLKVLANVERGPIDSFINENLNKYRVYFVYPKIIHTISTFSYCEGHEEPRNKLE